MTTKQANDIVWMGKQGKAVVVRDMESGATFTRRFVKATKYEVVTSDGTAFDKAELQVVQA